jgi:NNP family nitrate/nitrite transporter-like MFS transporter
MQILIPLVMTFGVIGGGRILENSSGWIFGKIPAGTETWIQNAGFVWLLFLIPLAFAAWFGMDNIRAEHVSPNISGPLGSFAKISGMLGIALIPAVAGLWVILYSPALSDLSWIKYPTIVAVIVATVFLLKLIPGDIKPNLERQFKIFSNKHTWIMSVIYTMTFGSFIGYSAGFALAIKVIFGFQHTLGADGVWMHDVVNTNGPSALAFAWMGPFIGAFIRPVGGWIADKVGGAKVTMYVSIVMIASALGVAYFMKQAYQSATPEEYFLPFFLLFLVLFAATGVGNGSTFRTIAIVFDQEQAGPVLGWTSAIAAYGAFVVPAEFGAQIKGGTPEVALYAFAAFYVICLFLNWWYYLGPKREYDNP